MLDHFFSSWRRLGGAMGILFLVLFLVGITIAGDPPTFDDPADEIREWFADNGEQFLVGDYLVGLAFVVFFTPFLSSLRGVLADAEGDPAVWSWVTFLGGILLLTGGAVAALFFSTLAYGFGVAADGDPETIRTLMYLDALGFNTFALGLVPFAVGSSAVIARTGVVWRPLALLGLLLAVFSVIAGASSLTSDPDGALGGIGFISFPGAALWILILSVAMILKREARTAV